MSPAETDAIHGKQRYTACLQNFTLACFQLRKGKCVNYIDLTSFPILSSVREFGPKNCNHMAKYTSGTECPISLLGEFQLTS